MNLLTALRGTALAAATTLLIAAPAYGGPARLAGGGPAASSGGGGAVLSGGGLAAPVTTGPAAPPQGPLPQTGCTITGTAAVCDLWAKPDQLVLPGAATPVPIWGFASTSAGAASTPGPVLVVDEGNQVTINVHNGLARNLALALPTVTGLAPDRTGVAPGGVATYTFTPPRPGTYLYEAGHTPDGARQAAMGLEPQSVHRRRRTATRPRRTRTRRSWSSPKSTRRSTPAPTR
jgi:FtsP/CotA-like multicopper oxidase with cupredoxin domain